MGVMERYDEPSDEMLAFFAAQGVMLDAGQRHRLARLEVIEGAEGLMALWSGLSGSTEERIASVEAVQARRGLDAWRLETNLQADKEAEARADAVRRARGRQVLIEQRQVVQSQTAAAAAAQDVLWEAFGQAKGRLGQRWGRGAWRTLEEDLLGAAWGEDRVVLKLREVNPGAERKATFLSAAMSEILDRPFVVQVVAGASAKA